MSLCYIIETIGKRKIDFFLNLKKCTSPANEFLLHKHRNKNENINFILSKLKKFKCPANEFLSHNRNNSKMKK